MGEKDSVIRSKSMVYDEVVKIVMLEIYKISIISTFFSNMHNEKDKLT